MLMSWPAPQLCRRPLLRPRHPHPPTDPHGRTEEARDIHACRAERCSRARRRRRPSYHRIQQDRPWWHTLRIPARHPGTRHLHPYRTASDRRDNTVLHAGNLRRGRQCEGSVQVSPRRGLHHSASDAGDGVRGDTDDIQHKCAADAALGCRGCVSDHCGWRRRTREAQQVRLDGGEIKYSLKCC